MLYYWDNSAVFLGFFKNQFLPGWGVQVYNYWMFFFFPLVLAQKALKMFQFNHKLYTTVALDKPRCLKEWVAVLIRRLTKRNLLKFKSKSCCLVVSLWFTHDSVSWDAGKPSVVHWNLNKNEIMHGNNGPLHIRWHFWWTDWFFC